MKFRMIKVQRGEIVTGWEGVGGSLLLLLFVVLLLHDCLGNLLSGCEFREERSSWVTGRVRLKIGNLDIT